MMPRRLSRRRFVQGLCITGVGLSMPYWIRPRRATAGEGSANDRPGVGVIGLGWRGNDIAAQVRRFGDVVALADVDRKHLEAANQKHAQGKAALYEDYRKLLEDKNVDLVLVGTPDHWHTRICVHAMQAGKDVYCEKPLTLTIEEGQLLCRVTKETGRVLQVGTQQRSEYGLMFQKAVALVQQGRIGRVRRVTCAIGGAPKGGPFEKQKPPAHLNWERWLGQAPLVDYIPQRCHIEFRWWYEYSGGKMTDWGAHHVDIAQWAIGQDQGGPERIEVLMAEHPVPLKKGYPTRDDSYNTATRFHVRCYFPGGVELDIRDSAQDLGFGNGILFEGDKGRFFVNRGRLTGKPVEALKDDPLPEEVLARLRKGRRAMSHMQNFIECTRDRGTPISDVWTHHRALTTCHLANIAIRLGRNLRWDAKEEKILGDDEAQGWLSRPQRKGYEITG